MELKGTHSEVLRKSLAILLICSMMSGGCLSSRSKGHKADVDVAHSIQDEVDLGKKIHQEILSSYYVYTKPDVVAYITDVGNSLSRHVKRELPYRFTILYNEKIYATSAPGGYVYITTGMMNFLENEAELAAVLSHEIAQQQYKDPALSHIRKLMSDVASTGATVAPAFGQIGMLAALGFVLLHAVSNTEGKSSEDRLQDADALALEYMMESGYDPQGLLMVLERFLDMRQSLLPYFVDYYDSRPISAERVTRLQEEFADLPLEGRDLLMRPKIYQEMTKGIREIYK